MRLTLAALASVAVLLAVPAAADDPKDPTMRSAAARARDREQIRQLNLAQLAYVRQRDAQYAAGWAAARAGRESTSEERAYAARVREHRRAVADHASAEADYERQMAAWRAQVNACQSGDLSACR